MNTPLNTDTQLQPGTADRPRLRVWRELTIFSSLLMELSWTIIWYQVLIRSAQQVAYPRAFMVLGSIMLSAYLLGRVLNALELHLWLRRSVMGAVLVVCLFAGMDALLYYREVVGLRELLDRPLRTFQDMANIIPPEFWVITIVLFVAWRGLAFVDRNIGPSDVLARFRIGLVMFLIYGLLLPILNEPALIALYLFLFFGLLSLSSARVAVITRLRGGQYSRFDRHWLVGIVGTILLVVGGAALLVVAAGEQIFAWLEILARGAIYLLVLLLSPLMLLVIEGILWIGRLINLPVIIQTILDLFQKLQLFFENLSSSISRWLESIGSQEMLKSLLETLAALRPLALWGGLLAALLLVLLAVRRYARNEKAEKEEEAGSQIDQPDLLDLLRRFLRRGLNRVVETLEQAFNLRQARRLLAAARIRRIYASLMRLSARLDQPRPASRTPLEFLPALERLFPGLSAELNTITQAYLLVRYGELPESQNEIEAVETAWRKVINDGQQQIRRRRRGQA